MIKGYLLSLGIVSIWIALQIIIFQLFRPEKKFVVFSGLFAISIPAYFGLYLLTPPDLNFLPGWAAQTPRLLGLFNGLFLHLLLYCTYAEMFYYVCRPVTLRILTEFLKTPDGMMKAAELQKGYSLSEMIQSRLETMVLNGYLERRSGHFFLTPKGKKFAYFFLFMRRFLGVSYYIESL